MKTRNAALIGLMGIVALVVMACSPPVVAPADPLEGTSWVLMTYRKSRPIEGTTITAKFDQGQVHGSSGCNTYFGAYEVSGDTLSVGQMGWTEMACMEPEGNMEQEMVYLELLGDAKTFEVTGAGTLIIRADGETLTFAAEE